MKPSTLVIIHSYHHNNTEKVAHTIVEALGAEIRQAADVTVDTLAAYDLIGFGAGIDSGKHYAPLLALAQTLPSVQGKKAFLFSTCGVYTPAKMRKDHLALRNILQAKGYVVLDEFSCLGFNTNSFLIAFGGINKGRPNADDLSHARKFAVGLTSSMV